MNEANEQQLARQADLDQNAAALRDVAGPVGAFYHGLKAAGIPEELAAGLIRDYQWLLVCKAFWPNEPPNGRPQP